MGLTIRCFRSKKILNLCNKKRQSMNTWYKRTLTCTRSRLYQFNFKFKKAPCQTGVFYNTSKDTWRYFIPETRLGVFYHG